VTLLFDENLSPSLCMALSDCYPNALHVRDIGLKSQPDEDVWTYAARRDLVIVTKDSDFRQRSFLYGSPPKVIWVGLGNCSTRAIERLLRERHTAVDRFVEEPDEAFLALTAD
jgi:predicted nuclease of predicted toxin-antitoxin system